MSQRVRQTNSQFYNTLPTQAPQQVFSADLMSQGMSKTDEHSVLSHLAGTNISGFSTDRVVMSEQTGQVNFQCRYFLLLIQIL